METDLRVIPGRKRNRTAVSVDPDDAESAYPIQEWMIPAQDAHGHSSRIISRISPSMKNLISVIVQSGKFPWKTDAELIRWCLWYGLQRIQRDLNDPDITNTMSVLGAVIHVTKIQEAQLQFSKVLEKASEVIQGLVSQGALPAVRKVIASIEDQIERMDDPDWKARYHKDLVAKFGYLMTEKKEKEEKNEDPR